MRSLPVSILRVAAIAALSGAQVRGQGVVDTTFTYQGQLKRGTVSVTDACDFKFALFKAPTGGIPLSPTLAETGLQVTNGLFDVPLNFGAAAFKGEQRFLEVEVMCPGDAAWTIMSPRHALTAAPYASVALKTIGIDGNSLDAPDGSPTNAVQVDNTGKVRMEKGGLLVFDDGGQGINLTSDSIEFNEGTSEDPVYDYLSTTDTHRFWTDGARRMVIDATGRVGIGTFTPTARLHLGGIAGVDGLMFPDGTLQTTASIGGSGSSLWTLSGSNIFYTAGRVSVGTMAPQARLTVVDPVSNAIVGECVGEGTMGALGHEFGGVYGYSTSPNGYAGYFEGQGEFTGNLRVGGRIGLGTSSPAHPLHAVGTAANIIYARGNAASSSRAVRAELASLHGSAVSGEALASTGRAAGVEGGAQSADGVGVLGYNDNDVAPAIAVRGVTVSPTGFGGYFEGRGYFSRRVGISIEDPAAKLHIGGTPGVDGVMFPDGTLQTTAASGGGAGIWSESANGIHYNLGNVGIGTPNPPTGAKLWVLGNAQTGIKSETSASGGWAVWGVATHASSNTIGVNGTAADSPDGIGVHGWGGSTGVKGLTMSYSGATYGVWGESTSIDGTGVHGYHNASSGLGWGVHGITDSETDMAAGVYGEATSTVDTNLVDRTIGVMGVSRGRDGIGVYGRAANYTTNDATYGGDFVMEGRYGAAVRGMANATTATAINYGGFFESKGGNGRGVYARATGANAFAGYFSGRAYISGDVGIGTSAPGRKLDVKGWTRTQVLEIVGGADLSEQFDVESKGGKVEPGMVVSIDADQPGKLILADSPYDRKVAGVVSGAGGVRPGMIMSQKGSVADGKHPIALTGRVWTWCDTANGTIRPGDLLTTSKTPGHAMKAADHAKAQGAMIGKAMTKLEKDTGLVLVLVSLQ